MTDLATSAPETPKIDDLGRAYATGRRKDAVARVWIKSGTGKIMVNGREAGAYFARGVLWMLINQPFQAVGREDRLDVV
jgi:small subunit ribosomal protein S9